jgi:anti-anti-sigma regulatory factor
MSALSLLDVTALSISTILTISLMLMVLGSDPKRTINRSFALFALAIAVSAVCDILRYLALWSGTGNPLLWAELTFLAQSLMGPLLLAFTVRYLGRRSRWTDMAVILGVVVVFAFGIPLFRHPIMLNVHLDVYGLSRTDLSNWGLVAVTLSNIPIFWSIGLFWQERHRLGEPYLAWGVFIMEAGYLLEGILPFIFPVTSVTTALGVVALGYGIISRQLFNPLRELTEELERKVRERTQELETAYAEVGSQVEERTAELQRQVAESERLQQEIIEAQRQVLLELSTPVIPVVDTPQGGIIVMPLVGSVDSMRARDIMRKLLAGIREHEAEVVILDVTGVPVLDSAVADHLNKTIQAARLKGARAIVTGISEAVAETVVDLGIDWDRVETLPDLQTGLTVALGRLGFKLTSLRPN